MRKSLIKTAVALALAVALELLCKPMRQLGIPLRVVQLVLGMLVVMIMTITALAVDLHGGLLLGAITPVVAYGVGLLPLRSHMWAMVACNMLLLLLLYHIAAKGGKTRRNIGWLAGVVGSYLLLCGILTVDSLLRPSVPEFAARLAPTLWKTMELRLIEFAALLLGSGIGLWLAPVLRKNRI